ncbi:polyribonucleotide nucleotidyltransferase [Bittarella massiliensis (ex Durand et al. 2017)]|uniref:polyribonucleotide nucleotidyltransferase n=1 Tax=Bittarella massiliensis (ex Durand et al. 2017) TaxID=1720313 RepID=UPI00073E7173|nr:polyribonucleotide nucleotidyltransferase [Bittarella massiliensis (ex Durand et al. 2017)]
MFEEFRVFETQFAGKKLSVETGKMCCLANGSCLVRYGETTVLCNATMSQKPREGIDFFPLSVDFEEKLYSVGRIPGSFLKRESRPSEKAVLACRMVDRPIRPLFPKDMRNDVAVVMTVMSVDPTCAPEIAGLIGTSIALAISDIPWKGPIGGVQVGLVDGKVVLNPSEEEGHRSDLHLTLAGSKEKIVMIECAANEVDNDTMLDCIKAGHEEIRSIIDFIENIRLEIGREKIPYTSKDVPFELLDAVRDYALEKMQHCMDTDDKRVRDERLAPLYEEVHDHFDDRCPDDPGLIDDCLYKLQKQVVRRWLLDEGKRVDGRGIDEIRPLAAEVGVLPRVHGSALFTRGQTQVLTIATLGPVSESQRLDGIDHETGKRYMHHYNFPSYSVGETRPSRGPGRREIGHGALAEKALVPVLPSEEEFPYAIRLVSEVLSSNGSTSQGSICASTLALMDAGVPIKEPVAGISCGLVTEGERWMTMVDIQGVEDFFGDMDFKVGGTKNGITAIQVDIKNDGLTYDIIAEAFEKTYKARMHILNDIMLKALPAPRPEVSQYAPKMRGMQIHPDKIREVIGSGGKVIQKICAECGVKVDVEDDGRVFVSGIDLAGVERAITIIKTIVQDPEVGALYKGVVTRLMNFGAFVEIAPGKEGLVHISKLDKERVEKVEDVVNVGDVVVVKVTEIDRQGRINLSRKDALEEMERAKKKREEQQEQGE